MIKSVFFFFLDFFFFFLLFVLSRNPRIFPGDEGGEGGRACKSEKWKKDGGLFSLGIKEMVVEVFTPAGRR